MYGSDMKGFGESGGPALVDRFGRPLRDALRIPQPVSGQLVMQGGETSFYLGAPPVSGSFQLYRNRVLVHPNVYTLNGLTLTLNSGKKFYQSDILEIYYLSLYPPKTVASLPVTPSYFSTVMADAPLGYWRANETSGTTMFDSSGNGYNAAYGPNVLLNQPALFPGNSSCIGMSVNDYAAKIVGPTGPLLALRSGAWTLECIVKKTGDGGSSASWMLAYDRGAAPTDPTPLIGMTYFGGVGSSGTPSFHDQVTSYNNSTEVYSPTHTGGSIMHLALVFDGASKLKGYENGVLAWSHDAVITTEPVNNICFLGSSQTTQNGFQGYGSDFAVYNKALTATRIAAHYASMIAGSLQGDRDPYLRTVDLSASNSPSSGLIASVDPTDPTQFKFVPNSGGGSAIQQIAKVVTSGSQSSVVFSSIPQTYSNLLLCFQGRSTDTGGGEVLCYCKINGDGTSGNYSGGTYSGFISTAASAQFGTVAATANGACIGLAPGTSGNANAVGQFTCNFINYAGTAFYKNWQSVYTDFFGGASSIDTGNLSGVYKSTSAINSITLTLGSGNFVDGSTVVLYGIS